MQNLLNNLEKLLSSVPEFIADGKLIKNKVIEKALNLDPGLLGLLLSDKLIKEKFFVDVDGTLVFDKVKFQQFVSNKTFLPDSYTAFKNKIGLTDNSGDSLVQNKDVVLTWAYKDCVLEGGQDKFAKQMKLKEIFYNETLAPDDITRLFDSKVFTKFAKWDLKSIKEKKNKKFDKFNRDENGIITDNLLIKGNNLLALHTLKSEFAGKIKMIYIDPPYNTGTDNDTFSYNNTFNHSTWLTFMKNRLEIAKKLLKTDGVLACAIDDNEQPYLGVLLHEVFPDDKYEITCITIEHNPRGVQGTNFSSTNEYTFFVYPKGIKAIGNRKIDEDEISYSNLRNWGSESERTDAKNCFYPVIVRDNKIIGFGDVSKDDLHPVQTEKHDKDFYVYPIDINGVERKWRYARQSVEDIKHLLRAKSTKTGGYEIEIGKDFGTYRTVWTGSRYDANEYGTKIIKSLVPDCKFDFPKSLWNVYDCLYAAVGSDKNAIVLDFFGGSGTTAHALLQMNKDDGGKRKFILIEQMGYITDMPEARIKAVIEKESLDESFVYCELMQKNDIFIPKIKDAKTSDSLKEIYNEMKEKAVLHYDFDKSEYENLELEELPLEQQKTILLDLLNKNHLYVLQSEIDDTTYNVSEEDKNLNRDFFQKLYGEWEHK